MDKPSFIIDSEIIKYIKKVEKKRRNLSGNLESFKPEQSTICDRRILYSVLSYKADEETKQEDDRRSIAFNRWSGIFCNDENVNILQSDVEVSDIHYNVSGKVDLVLHFENFNKNSICMIRCVNGKDFQDIVEKGPFKKDVITDMVYMWLSEIPNAIMIYENMDEEKFEIFNIVPYNPIIQAARTKFKELMTYKINGKLKDRPYKDQNNRECLSCEFKSLCWGNQKEEHGRN